MIPDDAFIAFRSNPPAETEAIERFRVASGLELPADFVGFLSRMNGGEGSTGQEYLQLWRVEDLLDHNRNYEVQTWLPGFLLIGSDLGGDAFGYDTNVQPWEIIRVPFIFEAESVCRLANSFDEFINLLLNSISQDGESA